MTTSVKHHYPPSDDDDADLANFHIAIHDKAHEIQKMRSGLLSDPDALRIARFEHFAKGLMMINNAIAHTRLVGGSKETRDEEVNSMLDYARTASISSPREIGLILANMTDKLSTEYQMQQRNRSASNSEQCDKSARADSKEDCCAP